MAIAFWSEPVATFDVDVFALLPPTSGAMVSLEPLYSWASRHGHVIQQEHIIMGGIPVQIIRETTLRIGPPTKDQRRLLTPLPDRAWNLSTALYYKAGAKPWRLAEAREGVCYIGIAFRKGDKEGASACCAAQMFLDSGDGIVFLGQDAPLYSEKERQFHLSKASAKRLLAGVLQTYAELDGRPLRD